MRHKELRLALVCYGGISLAVYMHGVTKEVWKLTRASSQRQGNVLSASEAVYADLLDHIAALSGVRVSVLPDIIAGASAGGLNGVFLAQAIHSGQSLEPLTRLWLERADIDVLLAPDARVWTGFAKQWAVPLVRMLMARGDEATKGTSEATNVEVRDKLARLVRSRWFEAPFSGPGFSRLIAEALDAMAAGDTGAPLLPAGHPLDLFTTATDYSGHAQRVALHSPAWVEEREHRVAIGFHAVTGVHGGAALAPLCELVFAARATASFPGAFPPLQVSEIDGMMAERAQGWPTRDAFLTRVLPAHTAAGTIDQAALMDGSVLENAPFTQAIAALSTRPAESEIDRRLLYIDPTQPPAPPTESPKVPGFFSVVFRALSTIPREQPIHDNLEALARQSDEFARIRAIAASIRPDVERSVEALLGAAMLQSSPTISQLCAWRIAAQTTAAQEAGYAYHAYARLKLEAMLDTLADMITPAAPGLARGDVRGSLGRWAGYNLRLMRDGELCQSSELVAFLRAHDAAFRIRRMRHLSRRLDDAAQELPDVAPAAIDAARGAVGQALSLAFAGETPPPVCAFAPVAAQVLDDPGQVLRYLATAIHLTTQDTQIDEVMAEALRKAPPPLARMLLLGYIGFTFYDVATLPLLRSNGLTEMDPVKVDRISPQDARAGLVSGVRRRLKGEEFHHFGAFFSRAYREHDYLLGRLHGAERMVDLLASTNQTPLADSDLEDFKRRLFTTILDEEHSRLSADSQLLPQVRAEWLGD
jgi:patatin-related protein